MRRTSVSVLGVLVVFLVSVSMATASEIRLVRYQFDPLAGLPELPAHLVIDQISPDVTVPYLVQLDGPVSAADEEFLAQHSEVLAYYPDHAFLVHASARDLAPVRQSDRVRWVGLWQPAYKLCPWIGTQNFVHPIRRDDPQRTLVVWTYGDTEDVWRLIEGAGASVEEIYPKPVGQRFIVKATDAALPSLAHVESVLFIEELPEYFALNDVTSWVIQTNQSNVWSLWSRGIRGGDQIGTVMDTGLDYNSCYFRDPGKGPGPTHRKVIDYEYRGGGAVTDGCPTGHGTHVSGTLAGNQTPITGATTDNGMAPDAKLTMQDIGQDDFVSCLTGAVFPPSDLTASFQHSYDLGAFVHNNSWGTTSNSYTAHCRDIDDFIWRHQDYLILFANGNSGPGSGTVGSPATAKNCVSVGSTRQAPNQETLATYSSRGPAHDGRLKPTFSAPGGEAVGIQSAHNDVNDPPLNSCATKPLTGTSMASPAVAGAALLVREYFTDGYYPTGTAQAGDSMSPMGSTVKAVMVNSAKDMGTANIPNNDEGWGRLLLEDALFFDVDTRELIVEEHPGVSTGNSTEWTYEVQAGEALEVTLVWSDFANSAGASTAILNNLDLTVVGPDGTWLGNVFSGGQSTTGGSADTLNVVEGVRLNTPTPGTYTVRVDGFNIPREPQPFAVVTTGAFDGWPPLCDEDASWNNYGTGFPGTLGIPTFVASGDPVIGSTINLELSNSLGASTIGLMFLGISKANIPSHGGSLLVAPLLVLPLTVPTAGLSLPAPLPPDPVLCGVSLFLQAWEVDAGARDGVSLTAGLELALGS